MLRRETANRRRRGEAAARAASRRGRPKERAILAKEVSRGPGATNIRLDGIARVRLPLAEKPLGAVDVELAVDLRAFHSGIHEHPPARRALRGGFHDRRAVMKRRIGA